MSLYQHVFYVTPGEPVEVQPQASIPVTPWQRSFVVKPYSFALNEYAGPGRYAATTEGLLGIVCFDATPPGGGGVYSNGGFNYVSRADGSVTPLTFFSALAQLVMFGVADEALTVAQQIDQLRMRKLAMRCGPTITLAQTLASQVGLTTRTVRLLNVTGENGFDDGHILLENQEAGRWVLYDVAGDVVHADPASGALLSIGAVINRGVSACRPIEIARHEAAPQPYPSSPTLYPPMSVYNELDLATPALRQTWRERVYQVPGIDSGGKTYWGLKPELWSNKAEVEGYSPGYWIALPWTDWVAKFYPNGL